MEHSSKILPQTACAASLLLLLVAGMAPAKMALQDRMQTPPQPSTHIRQARWQEPHGTTLSAADADDLYQEKCSLCHGADRTGKPPAFPTLVGVTSKYSDAEITKQIRNGKGRMPAYPSLTADEVAAIISVLKKSQTAPESPAPSSPPPSFAMLAYMPHILVR